MPARNVPSVPTASLPEFMRDPRKGHLVAVGLEDVERQVRDSLSAEWPPTVVASIEATADAYRDAVRELRDWHKRPQDDPNTGGAPS